MSSSMITIPLRRRGGSLLLLGTTSRRQSSTTSISSSRRLLSTATAAANTSMETTTSSSNISLIPTLHSWHSKEPRICRDVVELDELSRELLETPVGHLYTFHHDIDIDADIDSSSNVDDVDAQQDAAFQAAFESIDLAEYLARGFNAKIPGTLYHNDGNSSSSNGEDPNEALSMLELLLQRMKDEGDMYMQVRAERLNLNENSSSNSSSSSSDSDSESSSESNSDEDTSAPKSSATITSRHDFAPPGPTIALYDTLLDAMAASQEASSPSVIRSPMEYYKLTGTIVDDQVQSPIPGAPQATLVTFNAALRGIVAAAVAAGNNNNNNNNNTLSEPLRDEAIHAGFSIYNHMTHHPYVPRNSKTMVYMLQLLDATFVMPSRVKGNMSLSLWYDASHLGLVTDEVVKAIQQVHHGGDDLVESKNGPEFEIFLNELKQPLSKMPQRYRRHTKKYAHAESTYY